MFEAFPISLGSNMTCSDYMKFPEGVVSSSTDNQSGQNNVATLDLGYIPNVAHTGTEIRDEANKVNFRFI